METSQEQLEAGGVMSSASGQDMNENDQGISITWEDLWATVSNGRKGSKHILQGITGYARPGELLALMGPSGCGKTTLLDALAGKQHSNTRIAGDILINGRRQPLAYGTSAYVMQDEALIATLTVRESIHYSAQLQLPASMSKAEKMDRAEATIREMGLQEAANTRIGGKWGAGKGLSGGQRRRVSICTEMLTHPKLLFLDEPISGLDSAASYYVMSRIACLSKRDDCEVGRTVVVSVHQPSSEILQMFDNLCLLSSGRTIFFGPTSDANEFFALNGYPCPTLQNPSDHFLKIINKDFVTDIGQGLQQSQTSAEEAIDTLAESYKTSAYYWRVRQKVARIRELNAEGRYRRAGVEKKRNQPGFFSQCTVLTRRTSLNMYRDWGNYRLRLLVYILTTLGLGSLFYDVGYSFSSIQARGSLFVFVSVFLTFLSISGFPSFVEDMKVFERERQNGHYGVGVFVLSNTLASSPYLILLSVVPGIISYFLPGLQAKFDRLMYYILTLCAGIMLVESLMMVVASIVPNYLMGIVVGTGFQGLLVLAGGFFRLPNDLPKPFWKYPMYYISYHKYIFQGMFKNEFDGLQLQSQPGGGGGMISGDRVLRDFWQVDALYSKWVDLGVLVGMIFFYRLMFFAVIKAREIRPRLSAVMSVPSQGRVAQIAESPTPNIVVSI